MYMYDAHLPILSKYFFTPQANSTVTNQSTTSASLSLLLCTEPLSLTLYTSIKLPRKSPYLNDAEALQITVILSERCQVVRHGPPLKPPHSVSTPSPPHATLHSGATGGSLFSQIITPVISSWCKPNTSHRLVQCCYAIMSCVAKKCSLQGNNNRVYASDSLFLFMLSISSKEKSYQCAKDIGKECTVDQTKRTFHINHLLRGQRVSMSS